MDECAIAASFAEKGLKQDPTNIGLILNRARAFDGMERFEKANDIYLEIGKIADSIPEYHYYLANNLMIKIRNALLPHIDLLERFLIRAKNIFLLPQIYLVKRIKADLSSMN